MNICDIGKNIKLNYISLAHTGKVIPKDSFGTITGHPYEFEITWKVKEEFIRTIVEYESIIAMEKGGILEIIENVSIPSEPKFKENDLIKEIGIDSYYFIKNSKFDVAKGKYIYEVKDIEASLLSSEYDEVCNKLDEDEMEMVDKIDMDIDFYEGNKYNVKIENKS